ncbi:plasma membrane/prospore membrane sodium ion/proton antiporter Nhe1/Sod2 [Schizosaccharomyces pombe]|uniref:Na(+)/H(+) antiporter n=1 Tax=Schizosaccharomyces pombe (strain 972 / ATCC 24843) TaxID=284812 RepID=NAH_SCHPO|nr:plasma membrane sodium ion/proton antiporter Sod2 [Schizosaccharomyces pombe]P36606.1 RecName: Full=Na(+)/H(+) antiporter [Schizosaccharomyces pombe 972h-]CAA77796.1 putative sodium/proton antiporter [Schizosaccharomyces pombe]CAB69632.1 plasma membrane sodium ion/proton antiporter Sod2 [Schizosaccharomyces pombe]|eukprot:NP_592782.1 plasma membrane sodium ion/proton antiporter Sod2 [Schizosaccharomyces pombe]
MGWRQLDIDKVHLALIVAGGFITFFCYFSEVFRKKLLVGEAVLGSITGLIFGPHAAKLVDPFSWGDHGDYLTVEICRIVLDVRVFASAIELPGAYFQHNFRSIIVMLLPVMAYGWLVTAGFAYALFPQINFLGSLLIAGCITSTDPVLSALIVGEGPLAKKTPERIRSLLIAESGCNDGMAVPFFYFAIKLLTVKPSRNAGRDWVLLVVLYECAFGIFFGCVIGYLLSFILKHAQKYRLIDAISYYSLPLAIPLLCSGIGTIIGVDDLLMSFFAGILFNWNDLFSKNISACSVPAFIDQTFSLLFFTYYGTIIPWNNFNWSVEGLPVWRLIVFSILTLVCRRLPVVFSVKPLVPDIKTWKEALFVGHFGPIGVCAVYMAFLAKLLLSPDEIEKSIYESTTVFSTLNEIIWPIISFVILSSIIVHGFSIHVLVIWGKLKSLYLNRKVTKSDSDLELQVIGVDKSQEDYV